MLFDWLVVGQVIKVNPASPVRGPKYSVKNGKTAVLSAEEARKLLNTIDPSSHVGLRDRALIALMVYTLPGSALLLRCGLRTFIHRNAALGSGFTKKAVSATKCHATTILTHTCMHMSKMPGCAPLARLFSFLPPLAGLGASPIGPWVSLTLIG